MPRSQTSLSFREAIEHVLKTPEEFLATYREAGSILKTELMQAVRTVKGLKPRADVTNSVTIVLRDLVKEKTIKKIRRGIFAFPTTRKTLKSKFLSVEGPPKKGMSSQPGLAFEIANRVTSAPPVNAEEEINNGSCDRLILLAVQECVDGSKLRDYLHSDALMFRLGRLLVGGAFTISDDTQELRVVLQGNYNV